MPLTVARQDASAQSERRQTQITFGMLWMRHQPPLRSRDNALLLARRHRIGRPRLQAGAGLPRLRHEIAASSLPPCRISPWRLEPLLPGFDNPCHQNRRRRQAFVGNPVRTPPRGGRGAVSLYFLSLGHLPPDISRKFERAGIDLAGGRPRFRRHAPPHP